MKEDNLSGHAGYKATTTARILPQERVPALQDQGVQTCFENVHGVMLLILAEKKVQVESQG